MEQTEGRILCAQGWSHWQSREVEPGEAWSGWEGDSWERHRNAVLQNARMFSGGRHPHVGQLE